MRQDRGEGDGVTLSLQAVHLVVADPYGQRAPQQIDQLLALV